MNEVVSFDRKFRVPRQSHPQKKVAFFPAAGAGFSLAGQPNTLTFVDTARDLNLISLDLLGITSPERDLPG